MVESIENVWVRRSLIVLFTPPLALCAVVGGALIGGLAALVELAADIRAGWLA